MKTTPSVRSKNYAADALAFLNKQLELLDPVIQEPLSGTDWPRDMPVKTGGGVVENVSSIDVSYASTGGDEGNILGDLANDIPVMQVDFNKNVNKVFNFMEYLKIGYFQREKCRKLIMNLDETLRKGIRLHHDKTVDRDVYVGFAKVNSTGLCNNATVTRTTVAPHTPDSTDTEWSGKTADEILEDINELLSAIWTANDCASDGLPNHILVPVEQFGMLVTRKVSHDSERSILTYVLENNLVTQQGGDLVISPSKWCKSIGTGSSDRMVAYVNNEERIRFHMTLPLTSLQVEVQDMAFRTPFVSQFSEVEFLYPSLVQYRDGI